MKVFISYSYADAELASRIANALTASGLQVWDNSQILPGDNWGEKLAQALEESDAMVVLLTPNSLRSPNIRHEIGFALGSKDYKGRLIPVIAAPPNQLPWEDIPWVLNRLQMINLQNGQGEEEGLKKIIQTLHEAATVWRRRPLMAIPKEIFLSHSTLDHEFVTRLAETLRRHRIPVWYSRTNIIGAQQWHDEIGAALKRCDWFLLILSPNSVASMWVKRELLFVLQQNRFADRIVPIVYQRCDVEQLSWVLPGFQFIDFQREFDDACRELLRIWGVGYQAEPG